MADHKWTKQDNEVAKVELALATYLTAELNSRPEVSLEIMMMSQKVRERFQKIMNVLEGKTSMADVHVEVYYHKENHTRQVMVTIGI